MTELSDKIRSEVIFRSGYLEDVTNRGPSCYTCKYRVIFLNKIRCSLTKMANLIVKKFGWCRNYEKESNR